MEPAQNFVGLIKDKICWITGNGSEIKIWTDSILGRPTLASKSEFLPLRRWLDHGYKTLKDFAIWGSRGDWNGWIQLNPPSHLDPLYASFNSFLHGIAPLNLSEKDLKGWGNRITYTIEEGFLSIQNSGNVIQQKLWGKV